MIKNKIFMTKKFLRDLTSTKTIYKIAADVHSKELGEYYFVFDEKRIAAGKDQGLIKKFDKNGIPLNATYVDVAEKDYVYYPISIGQMGLSVFHTYLKSYSLYDRVRFMKFVDWFYENKEDSAWLTHVSLPQFNYYRPWKSAFSQSRGISILLRGYQLSGDVKYYDLAERALLSFLYTVENGGVTAFTKYGPFYEEYAARVPTLVLNGMIFSLFGVMDFMRVSPKNKLAKRIYAEGIHTLKNILYEFDLGFWTRLTLCKMDGYPDPDPATIGYHRLVIDQLKVLWKYTKDVTFLKFALRFSRQDKYSNWYKMYKLKYKALKELNRL